MLEQIARAVAIIVVTQISFWIGYWRGRYLERKEKNNQ